MLTEAYIEALLVDEKLADHVWEAWDAGEINDLEAWLGLGGFSVYRQRLITLTAGLCFHRGV